MVKSYSNKYNAIVIGAILLAVITIFSLADSKEITANIKSSEGNATLYFFYGEGCGYCAKEKVLLEQLENEYPGLKIIRLEIWGNSTNHELYQEFASAYDITADSRVPRTFIGNKSWLGYNATIGNEIKAQIEYCLFNGCESLI